MTLPIRARLTLIRRRIAARLRRVGPRADCPGHEPADRVNPCRCRCYGCRHHCAACWYQPWNLHPRPLHPRKTPR